MTKEKSVLTDKMKAISKEKILLQYNVSAKRTVFYFSEYKLVIEVDGKRNTDKPKNKEKEKKNVIKTKLGGKIIRNNPDAKTFGIYYEMGIICDNINESNKQLTEESSKTSLIDKISQRLLELEFNSNHSIKSKALKYVAKNVMSPL